MSAHARLLRTTLAVAATLLAGACAWDGYHPLNAGQTAFEAGRHGMKQCYEASERGKRRLPFQVRVGVHAFESYPKAFVKVVAAAPRDAQLESCVQDVFERMRFHVQITVCKEVEQRFPRAGETLRPLPAAQWCPPIRENIHRSVP